MPPTDCPFQPPAGSPFRWQPDQTPPQAPRLGILHLLVGTSCVAVYLAVGRTFAQLDPTGSHGGFPVFDALRGISGGIALAGLILWIARRLRGFRFPVYPGEVLLVALGIANAGILAVETVRDVAVLLSEGSDPSGMLNGLLPFLAIQGMFAIVLLVCGLIVKSWPWKIYFLAKAVAVAVDGSLLILPLEWFEAGFAYTRIPGMAADVVLLGIFIGTLRAAGRYPWTHWLGVALGLWNACVRQGFWLWEEFVPYGM
jgi:hypothetical protein